MLRNYVQETSNAPGTAATVNLAGAPLGRIAWLSVFASGAAVFYVMDDGAQSEAGFGTVTAGSPNTLTRGTVLWNSAGTTARLNFTGATKVFNDVPAERSVYADGASKVSLPGDLSVAGNAAVTGNLTVTGNSNITGTSTTGASTVNGTLSVTSNAGVSGSLTVTGGMGLSGGGGLNVAGPTLLSGPTNITGNLAVTGFVVSGGAMFAGGAASIDPAGAGVLGTSLSIGQISIYSASSGGSLRVANGGSPTGLLCAWFNGIGGLVGTVTTNGATTSYNTTSDYRLKDDIQDLTGGLDIVMNLRPRSFVYRSQPSVRTYGFIADEFASAAPLAQAVNGSKDAVDADGKPIYQGMDYGKPTPVLTAAVQELKRQTDAVIAALTARIAALEAKLP